MNGNIPHIKGVGDIAGDAVSIRYDADRFCMSKNDNIQFLSSVAEKMAAITKPVKEINMQEKNRRCFSCAVYCVRMRNITGKPGISLTAGCGARRFIRQEI